MRHGPNHRHDLGESSAGGWISTCSGSAASVPGRPRGPDAALSQFAPLRPEPAEGHEPPLRQAQRASTWRPRLVALDIDGTLVDRNGFLPGPVADAVGLVVQAGVPVVLSTGRSWHGTRPVFEE